MPSQRNETNPDARFEERLARARRDQADARRDAADEARDERARERSAERSKSTAPDESEQREAAKTSEEQDPTAKAAADSAEEPAEATLAPATEAPSEPAKAAGRTAPAQEAAPASEPPAAPSAADAEPAPLQIEHAGESKLALLRLSTAVNLGTSLRTPTTSGQSSSSLPLAGIDSDAPAPELELDAGGAKESTPSVKSSLEAKDAPHAPTSRSADIGTPPIASQPSTHSFERVETTASAAKTAPPEPPVSTERAADILRQVRLQLSPELRQATIQLEPRELGRISIELALSGGSMRADVRAEKRSTLEALERHVPELRAALEKAGLGTPQLALQLGLDQRRPRGQSGDSFSRASRPRIAPVLTTPAPRALERILARRLSNEGIDTYA